MCDVELPALDASLPVPFAMLVASLDAMSAEAVAEIEPAAALLQAQVLLVQADRLRALTLARLADVENRQLHDLDGSPSTATWVAEQHTSTTRAEVALARKLDRYPLVAARIAAGGLSVDGGVKIGRALTALRRHVDRPDGLIDGQDGEQVLTGVVGNGVPMLVAQAMGGVGDDDPRLIRLRADCAEVVARPMPQLARLEAAFLLLAARVEPGDLPGLLQTLVDAALPNELAKRADDVHSNRSLELIRDADGGGWTVRGRLDLECGELLYTALHAAMETDPDNPLDTEAAAALREQGYDPYEDGCLEVRSRPKRRHDGLKLLLRKALDAGVLGLRGKVSPHIAVVVLADTLHDQPGALPATAASGAHLPAGLIRGWVCDSALTRFVLSLGHRVIESSHTERTLRPHERRIKQIETGGRCQAAGCGKGTATGHRLIPHHATAYARSQTTALDDTVMLCESSHHDLHEGGKTLRLKDGRYISEAGWVHSRAA